MKAGVLLLALLLLPGAASAWTLEVDAPAEAPAGLPFLVRLCVAGGSSGGVAQLRLSLRPEEGSESPTRQEGRPVPRGRYGPDLPLDAQGRGCRDVEVEGPAAGAARIEAKARATGGEAKARAARDLVVSDHPIAAVPADAEAELLDAQGRALLRVPARGGAALLPLPPEARGLLLDGAAVPLPAPLAVRIVQARAGGGVVLENAGPGEALLAGLALRAGNGTALPVPAARLAPGERVLLAPLPAPDGLRHLPAEAPAARGRLALMAHARELDALDVPALRPGEAVDAAGQLLRLGRTRLPPEPAWVEGALVAYATPDAGAAPVLDLLAQARREVLVEGYTITSPDVAHALLAAHARGVQVRVLVEGAPVGGAPPAQAELLGVLAREGVEVRRLAAAPGFPARYASLHAKTIVVDREAVLVATENLHPSSYPAVAGAGGTRGFGLVVHDAGLARRFAQAFDADAAPWPDVQPVAPAPAGAPLPLPRAGAAPGPALRLEGRWRATPLFSPDAGVEGVAQALAGANASLDAALLFADARWDEGESPLLAEVLDAARRGARVRVLLDGHLDRARNAQTVDALREAAQREGLPLEARLAAPGRTLHAKLVLLDGRAALVGSMNWGEASALRNREAGLLLESEEVARWYGAWFEKEWEAAGVRETPALSGMGSAAALLLAWITPRLRRR